MLELIFVGDSLIEYYNWEARFPQHRVHNQGWSGETVQGLLGRTEAVIRQCRVPNFIFIMSGTNNIGLEELDFIDSYRQIIEKFHRGFPAATICCHTLPPILIPWLNPELVNQANRELRAVAAESDCRLIDVKQLFQEAGVEDCLVEDGVHISEQGYAIWLGAVAQLIGDPAE